MVVELRFVLMTDVLLIKPTLSNLASEIFGKISKLFTALSAGKKSPAPEPLQQFSVNPAEAAVAENANDVASAGSVCDMCDN